MESVSRTIADPWEGKSRREEIGLIIYPGSAGKTALWVRDMDGDPLHGAKPGAVPAPGGAASHWEATAETAVWGIIIPSNSRSSKGGGDRGVGGVHRT